jgi:hypothetical protein
MQKLFSPDELLRLGVAIDDDFRSAGLPATACDISSKR